MENKMKKWTIGVDLGGTEIKFGLFSDTLEKHWSIPTRRENQGAYILQDIAEEIKACCDAHAIQLDDLKGVGLGVPGPVFEKNIVKNCVNLGWGRVAVGSTLSKLLNDIPVCVGNDANVAALGEMWLGGGKGYSNLVMVTLGTGVGGGVVVDGKILEGPSGCAGEIGHIQCVDAADVTGRCGCGHKGCLEQIASATGIVNYAKRYLENAGEASTLRDRLNTEGDITAKDVLDAAKAGDAAAEHLMDKIFMYLGKAIANICNILNPECVLIGGGVSAAGEYLRANVEKYFKAYAFHGIEDTPIRLAAIGNQAGIAGAAYMIISEN